MDGLSLSGHLHGLGVYFPHIDSEVFPPSSDQVVPVAADRQRTDLAGMRDKAHHLVRIPVKRDLNLLGRKWFSGEGKRGTMWNAYTQCLLGVPMLTGETGQAHNNT